MGQAPGRPATGGAAVRSDVLRGPLEVVVNITNACNQHCPFCFNDSGHSREGELTDEELLGLADQLRTLKPFNVCFSGGEPLLRSAVLLECARVLSSVGIRISLATNGTLVTRSLARRLIDSGMREVQMSLDAGRADIHDGMRRSRGAFEKVVGAFATFRDLGFRDVSASFTLMDNNYMEIENAVDLLSGLDVPVLTLRPLLLAGRAEQSMVPSPVVGRAVARLIAGLRTSATTMVQCPDPLSQLFILRSGASMRHMEVAANGALIPSPYLRAVLGSVRRHRLVEYWDAGWSHALEHPLLRDLLDSFTGNQDLPAMGLRVEAANEHGLDLLA